MSWKSIAVILLVIAISISPRIQVGTLGTGRNIDLRYEDFILVLVIVLWFFHLSVQHKREIYFSPLFKPILIYIFLATISTCIGGIAGWIKPTMAFFFYFKEIQYFLIFIVVANFIGTYRELKAAIYSLIICAMANGFYSIYQVFMGKFMSDYYGTASLGEPGTFPTGGYLAITFLVSMGVFFVIREKTMKMTSVISAVVCGIGLLNTGSRASVLGVAFSSLILLLLIVKESFRTKNIRLAYNTILVVFGIFVIFYYAFNYAVEKRPSLERLSDVEHMKQSFFITRVGSGYVRFLNEFQKNPLFGLGKTATTTVGSGTGEAHNHYLRILAEMGIFGLMSFLYMLLSIIGMSLTLNKNSQSSIGKSIGLGCLLATLNLMVASIAQDAFLPVKVNETFWVVVGLTASAYSIELREQSDESVIGTMVNVRKT